MTRYRHRQLTPRRRSLWKTELRSTYSELDVTGRHILILVVMACRTGKLTNGASWEMTTSAVCLKSSSKLPKIRS